MRKQRMLRRYRTGLPLSLLAVITGFLPIFTGSIPSSIANEEATTEAATFDSPRPALGQTPLEEIPSIVPPPGKHQLKTSPTQALEFRVSEQNKYLVQFERDIKALQQTLAAEKSRTESEVKELKESNLALKQQTEEISAQLSSLKAEHDQLLQALRNPRGSRGSTNPSVRTTPAPSSDGENIPRALAAPSAGGSIHVIERGDNLITIARKYRTTVGELIRLNKIQDERKLQIGQSIILPGSPTSSPSNGTSTP